jgi:hypothetical protein
MHSQTALKGPDELREATSGAVRNLGPEGTKRGLTTMLPVALGKLQSAGEIRRIPISEGELRDLAAWRRSLI